MKHFFFKCLLPILLLPAASHAANTPQFTFPVQCTPEKDCWIVNYVDTDPAPDSAKDHTCGPQTYEGHKGTDIAIKDRATMTKGIQVLAPMDGRVLRLRDGEYDKEKTDEEHTAIQNANKGCGNGILIDHAPAGFHGLQTMYCHLKKGSIKVQKDQIVKQGEPIAEIGLSGDTQFPHLHFGVTWEGGIIDPFTGALNTDGCGKVEQSFWTDPQNIQYQPATIYNGGFSGAVPDFETIKAGTNAPTKPTIDGDVFLLWSALYNVHKDDEVTLKITAPYGRPYIERTNTIDKNRARQFFYSGKKLDPENPLTPGTYTGQITIKRNEKTIAEKLYTYTIE